MATNGKKSNQKPVEKKKPVSKSRSAPKKAPLRAKRSNISKVDTWLTERGLERLKRLAMVSESYTDLAKRMRINKVTLIRWRRKYPEIDDVVQAAEYDKIDLAKSALIESFTWRKVTHVVSKLVQKDKQKLAAERYDYVFTRLNQYKLDHPEKTKDELKRQEKMFQVEATKKVPDREQIDYAQTTDDLPPNENAALAYLRLRDPDFREPFSDETAEAQADLTRAQANIAKINLADREELHESRPINIIVPKPVDEERKDASEDEEKGEQ